MPNTAQKLKKAGHSDGEIIAAMGCSAGELRRQLQAKDVPLSKLSLSTPLRKSGDFSRLCRSMIKKDGKTKEEVRRIMGFETMAELEKILNED